MPVSLRAVLDATPQDVDRVHELLADLWDRAGDAAQDERDRFALAIVEVVGNVIVHGRHPGGKDHRVELAVTATPDRLEGTVIDDGVAVPDPDRVAFPEDMAEHGRGIPLAHAAADEVSYERRDGCNHWIVVVLLTP